jgi:hypothetical protein
LSAIRAALLGFNIYQQVFVATATALIADALRKPVYLVSEFDHLARICPTILLLSVAVLLGTVVENKPCIDFLSSAFCVPLWWSC